MRSFQAPGRKRVTRRRRRSLVDGHTRNSMTSFPRKQKMQGQRGQDLCPRTPYESHGSRPHSDRHASSRSMCSDYVMICKITRSCICEIRDRLTIRRVSTACLLLASFQDWFLHPSKTSCCCFAFLCVYDRISTVTMIWVKINIEQT